MVVVLILHSILRWVVIAVALVALGALWLRWRRGLPYDPGARRWSAAFAGLMDLQVLVGVVFFVWNGALIPNGFALRHRWEHLAVMLVAVVLAHLPALWKKRPDAIRYRNGLIAIGLSLLLIVLGISALPGDRWWTITGLAFVAPLLASIRYSREGRRLQG